MCVCCLSKMLRISASKKSKLNKNYDREYKTELAARTRLMFLFFQIVILYVFLFSPDTVPPRMLVCMCIYACAAIRCNSACINPTLSSIKNTFFFLVASSLASGYMISRSFIVRWNLFEFSNPSDTYGVSSLCSIMGILFVDTSILMWEWYYREKGQAGQPPAATREQTKDVRHYSSLFDTE